MPAEEKRPDQARPEKTQAEDSRSGRPDGWSDCRDDWRCCEPRHYYGPPEWDPYCGPPPCPPYRARYHHHGRQHRWPIPPIPGSEFFEAMMNFAASAAGSRGRWWEGMADATRYARRDMCGDPCYDPCAAHSYCDPCPPPRSHCDPCPPPWSYCDPCDPRYCDPYERPYERRGPREEPDPINLAKLREQLQAARQRELDDLQIKIEKATDNSEKAKLMKELEVEAAKTEAAIDAVIHDVKLARVTEAMRRKQWSRGRRHGYPC
jgi:hypothetical protein